MKQLMIIGAGGHGKVVADIAAQNGYEQIAFLDDDESIKDCGGYPIVGRSGDAKRYPNCSFIVAVGNPQKREEIQNKLLKLHLNITILIHPNAVIASNVNIGIGTVIMAGAVINPGTCIGKGCIINTCSSVDHDCTIENFVHISVGSHIAGTVHIGAKVWIGIGASISNNVTICCDCIIGAGAVVIRDIYTPGIYVGVPAKRRT